MQAPDPFYSEANMAYVKKSVQELKSGKGTVEISRKWPQYHQIAVIRPSHPLAKQAIRPQHFHFGVLGSNHFISIKHF